MTSGPLAGGRWARGPLAGGPLAGGRWAGGPLAGGPIEDDPMVGESASLLPDLLACPDPPAFALIHRPGTGDEAPSLAVLTGEVATLATLADIPLPTGLEQGPPSPEILLLIPYRQIAERGFACVDDGAPLLAITVTRRERMYLSTALRLLPDEQVMLADSRFDVEDHEYADIVQKVITNEIGRGEGANFVIKRRYVADIVGYSIRSALSIFRRLVQAESGSYWTFLVHVGTQTFVGATPERHISVADETAVMNPISGTLRYPLSGPTLESVERFLADRKEIDELNMVVDEELKMMGRICRAGGRVVGPYLKEMARLAHTEYLIDGQTSENPRVILRETMFAPTVTGSPLENACRIITRYEPAGRGHYGGVIALIGRDKRGGQTLDSAILIRTAEISDEGRLSIGVGATLVRHSDPASEVAETTAKAAGLLTATDGAYRRPAPGRSWAARPGAERTAGGVQRFANHPRIRAALARRNQTLAEFWLAPPAERRSHSSRSAYSSRPFEDALLEGRRTLIIDAEDTFTAMIAHQLRASGLEVTVRRVDGSSQPADLDDHDLVVMGPGPGDPMDLADPKMARLHTLIRHRLSRQQPFLAVCLSHQVLCTELGLPLLRLATPNQGTQKLISLFGSPQRVGFYNTFAASSQSDEIQVPGIGRVRVCRDAATSEVYALSGPRFSSFQFHSESILTVDGVRILTSALRNSLTSPDPR